MASSTKIQSLPNLEEGEVSLLELAADDARDVAPLSDKEAMILQLYHRVQEQKLEKALLQQGALFIPCLLLFGYANLRFLHRVRKRLRGECRRATRDRGTRTTRGPSDIYRQEESSGNGSYDRTKPESGSPEGYIAS